MLLLARTDVGYPDAAEPAVTYRLPLDIAPAVGATGVPAVSISRSRDGGQLQLQLAAVWPEPRANERRVPFSDGRYRLVLRSPTAPSAGEWRSAFTTGDVLVERSVSLTPVEASIARQLGERTSDLVDVDIELTVRGLTPSFPWLVSVTRAVLQPRIAALLRVSPAPWDAVEAAFLGLSNDTFTWYPLEPGALRPPRDAALRTIARHLAPALFTVSAGAWTLNASGPDRLDVSLAVSDVHEERVGFRWELSRFLAAQPDPRAHLVDLTGVGPFAASVITLVNDLPLSPEGLGRVAVEVRTGGPSGTLHHEFLPGAPSSARLTFVADTFDETRTQWRAHCSVMTANGPAVETTDFRAAGRSIDVNADTVGLRALSVGAEPEVFDHVEALEVQVGSRTLRLTREMPHAWAVGRRAPATVAVAVITAAGVRVPIGDKPVDARGLQLDPLALGIGAPGTVVVRPPGDVAVRTAYLAVQVEGHPWRTLDPDSRFTVPVRERGPWQPPDTKYRTRCVPRTAAGATGPMADSSWRTATGHALIVEL